MNTVGPIAIIGMGCRFPEAAGVGEYWKLLEGNTDAVVEVPRDRFDVAGHYNAEPGTPGKLISHHGGFLDGLYAFDTAFFGISPREARAMDPQQRLLLQVVWEAFEDAGIPPSSLRGSGAGVFVGQATADYGDTTGRLATADVRAMAGSRLRAVTAGRVSHAFDLRGPSLVLDTACSSSLVAVHTARQSLLTGECDLAIAAGVNVVLSPTDAIAYSQGRMLSPDGRCKFGDSSADGFVRSEGVGAVLLKRLPDALADGDPVHALLLGSAVTNDGDGSGLLLQPAVSGQAAMLRAAWRSAGVKPSQVDYVEAHGTGTTVGDGVELRALAEALRSEGGTGVPLMVGSVKTNIGHAEAAAGIAGFIKTVLVAKHRTVPASLHLTSPRRQLSEPGFPVTVVDRNTPLRPRGERAVLGVSSFGLSGTNAHVVIGEYVPGPTSRPGPSTPAPARVPEPEQSPKSAAALAPAPVADPAPEPADSRGAHLLVLSARSPAALRRLASRYTAHLEPGGGGRDHSLRDICRSAATGRDAHPFRLWAVGGSHDDLAGVLRVLTAGGTTPDGGMHEAGFDGPREVAFVFPGQGSQWRGMGRELLATSDAFRTAMLECDAAVREELGWSVVDLLLEDRGEMPDAVDVVQPVLWAMEVALAAHWRGMGVEPDLCVGHSMGEVAAACVAGALSVRDAARVICRRSGLMQRLAGRGAMLATELSAAEARELLSAYGEDVCVAVENSPCATVLAGEVTVLDEIAGELERRGVLCRTVKVNVASHSPVMDGIRQDLLARLADVRPAVPHKEMFSTVRCAPVRGADLDADYWVDNLRQPVRFAESVRRITEARDVVFVEVSPHPLLAQAVSDVQAAAGVSPKAATTLTRHHGERVATARSVGRVFSLGAGVDWKRWYGVGDVSRVPLPLYPWATEEFRAEPDHSHGAAPEPVMARPRLYERRVRLSRLDIEGLDTGVSVRGLSPVPPAVYLQAVAEAVRDLVGGGAITLRDVRMGDALPLLADARETSVRIRVDPADVEAEFTFTVEAVSSRSGGAVPCVAGTALAGAVPVESSSIARWDGDVRPADGARLDDALVRCGEYVPVGKFYRGAEARGYTVAPALRVIQQLWRRDGEAVARVRAPSSSASGALEAGLFAMIGAWPHSTAADDATCAYVPVSFESVLLADAPGEEYWSMARFTPGPGRDRARCDIVLTSPDGRVLADFRGMKLLRSPGREQEPAGVESDVAQSPASRLFIHTARVLGTTVDRVDPRRPLRDLGLDSLMAIQLRHTLRQDLGVEIPASRLLGDESAGSIAADIC
ncbi:acyltransferase domain-containing protein [Streptomyces sp. ISL-99]|uniref:type I polyketide synthase n=1 Tax=Streptomyces sp. ISL-99 TaxID=2819193 RepID=UPI001BE70C3B|nr:type I polyketide synthase [Streptomyces sp. ISL-99]MBT2527837.1 acyltransferase domain-containing protein [Streptomyces sp. ISL-99]